MNSALEALLAQQQQEQEQQQQLSSQRSWYLPGVGEHRQQPLPGQGDHARSDRPGSLFGAGGGSNVTSAAEADPSRLQAEAAGTRAPRRLMQRYREGGRRGSPGVGMASQFQRRPQPPLARPMAAELAHRRSSDMEGLQALPSLATLHNFAPRRDSSMSGATSVSLAEYFETGLLGSQAHQRPVLAPTTPSRTGADELSSRFLGVVRSVQPGGHVRFIAYVTIMDATSLIGEFESELEAAFAYDKAMVELLGPYSSHFTNFATRFDNFRAAASSPERHQPPASRFSAGEFPFSGVSHSGFSEWRQHSTAPEPRTAGADERRTASELLEEQRRGSVTSRILGDRDIRESLSLYSHK